MDHDGDVVLGALHSRPIGGPIGSATVRGHALLRRFERATYDWERDEWTNVPLGFQIGVVRSVAKQPFRFYVNPQWNFKDITGAVKSKVVFGVTLLAPAG